MYSKMELAVLKGVIEHDRASAYFASLLGLNTYVDSACDNKLLKSKPYLQVTRKGRKVYKDLRLAELPSKPIGTSGGSCWNFWKWGDRLVKG